MIDFSPFQDAVQQLSSALEEQASEPHRKLLRAGLIQTFEYTYAALPCFRRSKSGKYRGALF